MIRFEHVTKQFVGSSKALDDITVEIADGDFVFLIGPSGAGKSTLLKLIIREHIPTSGTLFVDEWEVPELSQSHIHLLRRRVAMVFQDYKLLLDRTVFENVALGLEIIGKHQEEIEKGVVDVLELVGLEKKHNYFPTQLSAGERQRTSIARAIVGGPKILLADEPTGNLDPETAWEIMNILSEIHAMGTTVFMATHNALLVNHMKKRTIAMKHGVFTSDEAKGRYHVSSKIREKEAS